MEPLSTFGLIGQIMVQLLPVWISLIAVFSLSIMNKRKLGLYGQIFDSPVGMIGLFLVLFWVFVGFYTSVFGWMATHDPWAQISGMKNVVPGTPVRGAEDGEFQHYLLGGDRLARDVFSRVLSGAGIVLAIAPLATFFGYLVGITLGLPAGYYGGKLDTALSFLANLILAFPVILLFYLLVTPEIAATGLPTYLAAVFFIFPLVFITLMLNSRFSALPKVRAPLLLGVVAVGFWIYASAVSDITRDDVTRIDIFPAWLDLFNPPGEVLVIFIAVVFVNSPTIFRIMRGLTLDVRSRDYVAAAQTRGESAWYIMLWEILPNVRGPLIVDFCLRIGYATILIGTLGFFGLGLAPESADWGNNINQGRQILSSKPHIALVPALSLLSLVLGLNLLADGLREESLKD